MKLLLVLALVALLHGRSLEKRALPEDLIWDGMNMGDVNNHRIIRPIPYIGEHALDRQIRGLIRDGVIIEKVPFSLRDDVIIEKVPFGIRDDVIIEKIPYNAEVLEGVLVELKNRYENLRQEIHNQLDNKLEDVRQAYQLASAIVAENVDNVKSSPEYQQAVAEAKRIKDELRQVLEDKYGNAKEKIDELLGEKSEELGKIAERVHEGIAKGVDQAKKVVAGIKGWVWDAVDEFLEPYTDKKKRELKSYQQMSAEERAQWDAITDELKQVLKDKYGVQDPEEAYRLSPESREKLAELRKEFLQKHGQTGHDDLTDDEFKKNWEDVASELEARFNQKRGLKSFQQMSPEERDQWNSVLAELRQVLKNKFGIQDPDEAYRLSPESREKLAELRKEFLQKHGQTGHDDLTDAEVRDKYQNVLDELKQMFGPRRVD